MRARAGGRACGCSAATFALTLRQREDMREGGREGIKSTNGPVREEAEEDSVWRDVDRLVLGVGGVLLGFRGFRIEKEI